MLSFSLLLMGSFVPGHSDPLREPPAQGGGAVSSFSVLLMERFVDDADPADEQPGFAVEFDMYNPDSILGWEVGYSHSSDDADDPLGDFEATVDEIYAGVRKTFGKGNLHPYVGGGLGYVMAEAEVSGLGSADDESFGLYVHGGAYWTLGQHFNVGADIKVLAGTDLEFGDADYGQLGLVFGYSL